MNISCMCSPIWAVEFWGTCRCTNNVEICITVSLICSNPSSYFKVDARSQLIIGLFLSFPVFHFSFIAIFYAILYPIV